MPWKECRKMAEKLRFVSLSKVTSVPILFLSALLLLLLPGRCQFLDPR